MGHAVLEREVNIKIIETAIKVLEKDAAILKKITEMPMIMLSQEQKDLLLILSKLSFDSIETLKQIRL